MEEEKQTEIKIGSETNNKTPEKTLRIINEKKAEKIDVLKLLAIVLVLFIVGFAVYTLINIKSLNEYNLPSNVYNNPTLKEAYIFAIENPEVLEKYPCYCGCMEGLGHKNNKDCFFNADGSLADHASMCSGCVGVALEIKRLTEEGKDYEAILKAVDEKYNASN